MTMTLQQPVPWYDILVAPCVRDAHIYAAGVLFWFAVQFAADAAFKRLSKRSYAALPRSAQVDLCVRVVAIVNGLVCLRSAYLFLAVAPGMSARDLFEPMPAYRAPQALLISYFIWDVCVCFMYDWGAAFLAHGFVSGFGMYLCSFPVSDAWSPYFSGVFEISNVPLHVAAILRACGGKAPALCKAFDALFVVLFFGIRILAGTYFVVLWTRIMLETIAAGNVHSYGIMYALIVMLWGVMALQYFWSKTVLDGLLVALGMKSAPADDAAVGPAGEAKNQ
jgi:hypothetical protein